MADKYGFSGAQPTDEGQSHCHPKQEVLDQGKTVQTALEQMGCTGVNEVRVGKYIEIEMDGDPDEVKKSSANTPINSRHPNIEDYRLKLGTDEFAVLQFPGSNCDQDCVHVLQNVLGHPTRPLWHKENSLGDVDAVIVPGGFSYGDYLRTGSIARFGPVMAAVQEFAEQGGCVLGICNGFQILCEAGVARRADPQPVTAIPLRTRLPTRGHT